MKLKSQWGEEWNWIERWQTGEDPIWARTKVRHGQEEPCQRKGHCREMTVSSACYFH